MVGQGGLQLFGWIHMAARLYAKYFASMSRCTYVWHGGGGSGSGSGSDGGGGATGCGGGDSHWSHGPVVGCLHFANVCPDRPGNI